MTNRKLSDTPQRRPAPADLVPSNWLDPLLTGPTAVLPGGYRYCPQDIERLLNAIRARIENAMKAEAV